MEQRNSAGFKLKPPQTREDRQATTDREQFEKKRLAERSGGYFKYEKTEQGLTHPTPGTLQYASDAERMHTDATGELRDQRQAKQQAKATATEHRRTEYYAREERRHRDEEDKLVRDKERVQQLQQTEKAKANRASVPYDMITLHYNDGADGQRLKAADDVIRDRARVREESLWKKNHTVNHNILTGEDLSFPDRGW